MSNEEFSNTFDTLIRSYDTNITFDDYEKSVFLTQAQEDLIVTFYNQGVDSSEELRAYLGNLIDQDINTEVDSKRHTIDANDTHSYIFELNTNVWFLIYESVDWDSNYSGCLPNKGIQVIPVSHDEYSKIKNNPFRKHNDIRVLKLNSKNKINDNPRSRYSEIISKYPIISYCYRYIKKPDPIIISTLPTGITINSSGQETPCKMHEALHDKILQLAVSKALQSKGINNQR